MSSREVAILKNGATVTCGGNMLSISVRREDQRAHTWRSYDSCQFKGWSIYSFTWAQSFLLPLCGLEHHTAPAERAASRVATLSPPLWVEEEALGSWAAAVTDRCASVHVANLSHGKHIPAKSNTS